MEGFSEGSLRWLEVLLHERFGFAILLQQVGNEVHLSLDGEVGCVKFDRLRPEFQKPDNGFPCCYWNAEKQGWKSALSKKMPMPGEKQPKAPLIEHCGCDVLVHYDILGFTYWMLSRLEEVNNQELDSHNRFPAIASHAFKYGYLERPVVDEWLHILAQVIKAQWPNVRLIKHVFNVKVSHDVDMPSRYFFTSFKGFVRSVIGDVIKRKDLFSALYAPWVRFNTKSSLHAADPFNYFDWIMDLSEKYGVQSAFYFMSGKTHNTFDADYELGHPVIRSLLRNIYLRGHEIGLHPSYNTYTNPKEIAKEGNRLKEVCEEEGIIQNVWGGRMHYLRWKQPITSYGWTLAGFDYDSTLSYADLPGFRCGTCFEYDFFDPLKQQQIDLRIRPLIVMECTVMAKRYLGLGNTGEAFKKFIELKLACKSVNGCFTLLWHNSEFMSKKNRELYESILSFKEG